MGLLGGAAALAVVARTAGGDHVHPGVHALLRKGDDVLARQVGLVKMPTAVSAHIAVAQKQFAVGQAGAQIERIDVGHATCANDAVDPDHRLLTGDGVVAAAKDRDLGAGLPSHLACGVVDHRLFQRNPGLGKPLRRQLQDFHKQRLQLRLINHYGTPHAAGSGTLRAQREPASQYTPIQ